MRVLVIRNAYDKDAGGAEQYALNLCVVLQRQGIEPLLMTRVPDIIAKAKNAGVATRKGFWHSSQEWGKHYFIRYPLMVLWYCWVLLTQRIDVVHPQGRDDFIFATQAARLLGKRVVWTDHADLKVVMDQERHPFPYLRHWIVAAATHTKAIICVSEAEKRAIAAVAPELADKLTMIHNGVFLPDTPKPVEKDAKYIVATNARLVPDKGISELIDGFAASSFVKDSKLWLMGGDSSYVEQYKQQVAKHNLTDRVRFIGYVPNPNDYIAAADVFVHASYHEAFSLAITEAAMLGRPIIATNVGGAPELLTEGCGILIPPKSAKAITEALDDLLAHPTARKSLSEHAQQRAHESFDFVTIVKDKVIPLYS